MLRIISVLEAIENDHEYEENQETIYKLVGHYNNRELPIVLNYLLKSKFNFKVDNNYVSVKTSNLDSGGLKILCNNLKIEVSKYQ